MLTSTRCRFSLASNSCPLLELFGVDKSQRRVSFPAAADRGHGDSEDKAILRLNYRSDAAGLIACRVDVEGRGAMDQDRAEEFCRSYGRAVAADDPAGIAGHYGFPHVSFTLGAVHTFADREQADGGVTAQCERLRKCGAGNDIRLADLRVQPVSDSAALCHLTWEIHPADGKPGWQWLNIYGLRQLADTQYFEFNVSDNEFVELLRRYPDIMAF
jgi:hypothetical protein